MKISVFLFSLALCLSACQGIAPRDILGAASPAAPATATIAAETPLPTPATRPAPGPTATENSYYPCGRAAATLTARIPATQTMLAQATVQTLDAPTLQAVLTGTAPQACAPGQTICDLAGHFFMRRPIAPAGSNSVDQSYTYGSTQQGVREPHHGVEFPNAQGTPVLAVADGTVVFAGDDQRITLAWVPAFYGNVVVIYHRFAGLDEPVFSLYAHLYMLEVVPGQQVGAGQEIGQVGATGTAIGSHLHFEVRQGKNDYRSNRNPELWLAPPAGTGVLAGRIEDSGGRARNGMINVQRIEQGQVNPFPAAGLETYNTSEPQPVNPDDGLQENFAAGELPVGDYRLSLIFNGRFYEQVVTIRPGRLTFIRFVVN